MLSLTYCLATLILEPPKIQNQARAKFPLLVENGQMALWRVGDKWPPMEEQVIAAGGGNLVHLRYGTGRPSGNKAGADGS